MFGKDFTTTNGAKVSTVTAASATVSSTLLPGKSYSFCVTTNCWIKQGVGAQTAVAATANNVLVPAGGTVFVHGSNGENLAVVRDAADGTCSLNLMTEI